MGRSIRQFGSDHRHERALSSHEVLRRIAEVEGYRNGRCENPNAYSDYFKKLHWQCFDCNCRWTAALYSVWRLKSWCRRCSSIRNGKKKWKNEIEIRQEALAKGYKILSTKTGRSTDNLNYECLTCGESKKMTPSQVRSGSGCTSCYGRDRKEQILRSVLSAGFGITFSKAKPHWLKVPAFRRIKRESVWLEYDALSEKPLKRRNAAPAFLSVEHDGKQHEEFIPHFHKTKSGYLKGKYYDDLKTRRSYENNVILIRVPELIRKLPLASLKSFLKGELEKHNFVIPKAFRNMSEDYSHLFRGSRAQAHLKRINAQLDVENAQKGAPTTVRLLSDAFVSYEDKLTFYCSLHGKFEISADSFKQGDRCQTCSSERLNSAWQQIRKATLLDTGVIVSKCGFNLLGVYDQRARIIKVSCEKRGHEILFTERSVRYKSALANGCIHCRIKDGVHLESQRVPLKWSVLFEMKLQRSNKLYRSNLEKLSFTPVTPFMGSHFRHSVQCNYCGTLSTAIGGFAARGDWKGDCCCRRLAKLKVKGTRKHFSETWQ